jgi:hypothetical protein
MSCGFILGVSMLQFFVSLYSILPVPIVVWLNAMTETCCRKVNKRMWCLNIVFMLIEIPADELAQQNDIT